MLKSNSVPKILYFFANSVPTDEEQEEVEGLDYPVQLRNAQHAAQDDPEKCDGVLGTVPDNYMRTRDNRPMPDGDKAMENWRKKTAKERADKKAKRELLRQAQEDAKTPPTATAQGGTFTPGAQGGSPK